MADTPQVPGWTLVPVAATWWHADQLTMRTGTYVVSLPRITSSGTPKVIIPAGVWAQGALATTPGAPSLSVSVPAADDPAIRESGWQVQIVVTMGTVVESYAIEVPEAAAVAGINLRDYTPVTSALPALAASVGLGVPSGLALIDATGTQVVDANGTVLSGGGGGGAVASVAGRTGAVTLTSSDLTDSTTTGRAVVGAADAAAARAAIGAGTSSLVVGTTGGTAAAGNDARLSDARTPLAHNQPASTISDSTTVGRSVLTAADAAAGRAALGAGTSSLVLGTTAGTAKAGDYAPTRADISDATADGRTIMAAPALAALDVWQASNGTWPARPSWAGRINWVGYPALTSTPSGMSVGDTYMQRV